MTENENKMLILIKEMYEYYNKDSLIFARRIIAMEQELGIIDKKPVKSRHPKHETIGGERESLPEIPQEINDLPVNPFEDDSKLNILSPTRKEYDDLPFSDKIIY